MLSLFRSLASDEKQVGTGSKAGLEPAGVVASAAQPDQPASPALTAAAHAANLVGDPAGKLTFFRRDSVCKAIHVPGPQYTKQQELH